MEQKGQPGIPEAARLGEGAFSGLSRPPGHGTRFRQRACGGLGSWGRVSGSPPQGGEARPEAGAGRGVGEKMRLVKPPCQDPGH